MGIPARQNAVESFYALLTLNTVLILNFSASADVTAL